MCFTKKLVIFFMVILVPQTLLGGEGPVFELRTYTTADGRLP